MDNIKMVVMDMDGTLLNSQNDVSPYTREVLIDLQKQGMPIVLASGRDISSLRNIGTKLDIALYPMSAYICLNGLEIYDSQENLLHRGERLSYEDTKDLCELAKDYHLDIVIFFEKCIYTIEYGQTKIMENHFLTSDRRYAKSLDEIPQEYFSHVKKVAYVQFADQMTDILKQVSQDHRNHFDICKVEDDWVEISPLGINKGDALKTLANIKNIPLENMICFGNGENDISMIKAAGISVAMGNAYENVKEQANHVCLDNNHDGIGDFLKNIAKLL